MSCRRKAGGARAWKKPKAPRSTALRGLYNAVARIPGFAGRCYTQLTDVEQDQRPDDLRPQAKVRRAEAARDQRAGSLVTDPHLRNTDAGAALVLDAEPKELVGFPLLPFVGWYAMRETRKVALKSHRVPY